MLQKLRHDNVGKVFAELRGSKSLRWKVWGREPEYLSSNSASAKLDVLGKIINI